MTVDGSPMCEPHDSIAEALWRAMEMCKTKCLEHVSIICRKAASKREQSSSLELPSGSGFHKEFVKGGGA